MEIKDIQTYLSDFGSPHFAEVKEIKIFDYPSVINECSDPEKYQELWDKAVNPKCIICEMLEKGEIGGN